MSGSTWHFACNTYSYTVTHDAVRCLTHLADLGFSEIELMMYPGHLWPPDADAASRRELRRTIEALGLRLISLNMPNIDMNIAGASPQMRRYTLDLLQGIIALAGDLGVPGIVIGPGKANPLMAAPRERLLGYLFEALDVSLGLFEVLFKAFAKLVRRGSLSHFRQRFHQLILSVIKVFQFVDVQVF